MIQLKEALAISEELDLYLVANGLKPAALIGLDPRHDGLKARIETTEIVKGNTKYVSAKVPKEIIREFTYYLKEVGLPYSSSAKKVINDRKDSGEEMNIRTINHTVEFSIGSNQANLERLLSAKGDIQRGLALDYPKDAVLAYLERIDGELRNSQYFFVSLAKAKRAGIELPLWLAYISFVPERMDFIKGEVSESSRLVGERYQQFVRKNNPELAMRVESAFFEKKLPEAWKLLENGEYSLRLQY